MDLTLLFQLKIIFLIFKSTKHFELVGCLNTFLLHKVSDGIPLLLGLSPFCIIRKLVVL
jgi:hypothetical protein